MHYETYAIILFSLFSIYIFFYKFIKNTNKHKYKILYSINKKIDDIKYSEKH